VLHQQAQPVGELTGDIHQLIDDMVETMYAAPGIGLAAPQIGVPLRIFVIDLSVGGVVALTTVASAALLRAGGIDPWIIMLLMLVMGITIGAAILADVQPPFERVEVSFFWIFTLATSAGIAFLAFVPAMIAILLAESFSWRSILYYALIGGAIGLFFGAILPTDEPGRVFLTRGAEIMAGAGVAAGLVYWLFAGRNAGRWREVATEITKP